MRDQNIFSSVTKQEKMSVHYSEYPLLSGALMIKVPYLQRLSSIGRSSLVRNMIKSLKDVSLRVVFVQVELNVCPVAEDLCTNSDLVGPNVKLAHNVLDKGHHLIVVGLAYTSRGVQNKENVSLCCTDWNSLVLGLGNWK